MNTYYQIGADQKILTKNISDVFGGKICPHCQSPIGPRVNVIRRLDGRLKYDTAFTKSGPFLTYLYSKRMIELLISVNLGAENFTEVVDDANQVYYELLPNHDLLPWVGVKPPNCDPVTAMECPQCRMQVFVVYHKKMAPDIGCFISESSCKKIKGHLAIAGYPHAPELIMDEPFMRRLRAEKIKKISFGKFGVLLDAEVELPLTCCTLFPAKIEPPEPK
jgi:hypothetical protein